MPIKGSNKVNYQREYMKKKRQGITLKTGCNAVIPLGVTLFWYRDGKREELSEVPEGCKVLSDGQIWKPEYPDNVHTFTPLRDLTPEERAKLSNMPVEHPVMKYLIDSDKRAKMEAIVHSLKGHKQTHNVYLGCGKNSMSLDMVGELLEVTG